MVKYSLCDRGDGALVPLRGISCDEDGVSLAGEVPLVRRCSDRFGVTVYERRPVPEINFLFLNAYGPDVDLSDRIAPLYSIARHLSENKFALAKIAAVYLRLPDLPNDQARARLLEANARLMSLDEAPCECGCSIRPHDKTRKRDVSNEPRVPAGRSDGGEWEAEDGGASSSANPALLPVQTMPIPMPMPIPFELPVPPFEIVPPPLDIPHGGIREPIPANPYPDRPDCAEEWAHAQKFCEEKRKHGKLKPGYSGFGKDIARCILGLVSQDCGGNATSA